MAKWCRALVFVLLPYLFHIFVYGSKRSKTLDLRKSCLESHKHPDRNLIRPASPLKSLKRKLSVFSKDTIDEMARELENFLEVDTPKVAENDRKKGSPSSGSSSSGSTLALDHTSDFHFDYESMNHLHRRHGLDDRMKDLICYEADSYSSSGYLDSSRIQSSSSTLHHVCSSSSFNSLSICSSSSSSSSFSSSSSHNILRYADSS